jgi:hypothetical protein
MAVEMSGTNDYSGSGVIMFCICFNFTVPMFLVLKIKLSMTLPLG